MEDYGGGVDFTEKIQVISVNTFWDRRVGL